MAEHPVLLACVKVLRGVCKRRAKLAAAGAAIDSGHKQYIQSRKRLNNLLIHYDNVARHVKKCDKEHTPGPGKACPGLDPFYDGGKVPEDERFYHKSTVEAAIEAATAEIAAMDADMNAAVADYEAKEAAAMGTTAEDIRTVADAHDVVAAAKPNDISVADAHLLREIAARSNSLTTGTPTAYTALCGIFFAKFTAVAAAATNPDVQGVLQSWTDVEVES